MEQILFVAPVADQLDEISKNVFQEYSKDNKTDDILENLVHINRFT